MTRLLVVLTLGVPSTALACTCGWSGFPFALSLSHVAFEGVAVDDWEVGGKQVYLVNVTGVFRGHVSDRVLVTSDLSTCGTFPQLGAPWVFVIRPENEGRVAFESHACDGSTRSADLTATDWAALGPTRPPTVRPFPWYALLLVPFLGLALWLLRRKWPKSKD